MKNDDRYSRQIRFTPIGAEGQLKIGNARIALIGAGAVVTRDVAANAVVAGVPARFLRSRENEELAQ